MSLFPSQDSYNDRMRAKGLEKVSAWVPAAKRDWFLDLAEDLRKEHLSAKPKKETPKQ